MINIKELLQKAINKRLAYLREWMSRFKSQQNNIQTVLNMTNNTEWESQVFSSLPEVRQELFSEVMLTNYERGTNYLIENLPLPSKTSPQLSGGTVSITTSGSAAIFATISSVSEDSNLRIQDWAKNNITIYRKNQETQKRVEKVELFLQLLNSDLVEELETAKKSYLAADAGVGERHSAGNDMRNLLAHYKGALFEKAKKWPKENKLNWKAMADRLALNGVDGTEHSELLNQEEIWGSLQERLTWITKREIKGLTINLADIWSQLIDHLFTVLGIVTLE